MDTTHPSHNRYHRQMLLPGIGEAGQRRLAEARVLLVGCGALGTTSAEQLARAGVGYLRIVDRDIVELTNLQRQVLFDERDAREGLPKAVAAHRRLGEINSEVEIDARVADVNAGNVEELAADMELIVDGTDNVETRYLLNDVAVKRGICWIYGGCVGMGGRAMAIAPGKTSCLRCLFPQPSGPGELETCDTAGVLGPIAAIVGAAQAAMAINYLSSGAVGGRMMVVDLKEDRFLYVDVSEAKRSDCLCCGQGRFEFLDMAASSAISLCGRNAVQVRPAVAGLIDLKAAASRLGSAGEVAVTPYLVRCKLADSELSLCIFGDGRAVVYGTSDPARARSLVARYVGS